MWVVLCDFPLKSSFLLFLVWLSRGPCFVFCMVLAFVLLLWPAGGTIQVTWKRQCRARKTKIGCIMQHTLTLYKILWHEIVMCTIKHVQLIRNIYWTLKIYIELQRYLKGNTLLKMSLQITRSPLSEEQIWFFSAPVLNSFFLLQVLWKLWKTEKILHQHIGFIPFQWDLLQFFPNSCSNIDLVTSNIKQHILEFEFQI